MFLTSLPSFQFLAGYSAFAEALHMLEFPVPLMYSGMATR